jgi:hypothetical protein
MDPNRKIAKKFDSKVINRQYFHRKTGLYFIAKVVHDYLMHTSSPIIYDAYFHIFAIIKYDKFLQSN